MSETLKEAVRTGQVGSVLNVMNKDYVAELQRIAVEESPNGIPLIFARDVIHGFKTIFPIPLGQAATWNPEIVEKGSRVAAEEASTYGIRWTFAPMLDISRDPRWGRIAESPGEDPYLASVLGKAYVKGFQTDDLSNPTSLAACGKHFIGYGAAEGGRDYNTALIPENLLRDVYLKPFKAAHEAGVASFMTSFNDINGIPASATFVQIDDIPIEAWQSSLGNASHYLDLGYKPQYPFGFGLSYTTFQYNKLKISKESLALGDSLTISADIKNTGSRQGTETVQLYVRDLVGDLVRPVKELKGFK